MKNGTYTGCSFEFYSKDYEIEERTKGDYLVTHKAFEKLTALTIAMDPAYEQTSVNAREEYENGKVKTENGEQTHPNPPCEGGGTDLTVREVLPHREDLGGSLVRVSIINLSL